MMRTPWPMSRCLSTERVQGFCTSGGYSHHAEKSIAFALVPRAEVTDDLQAEIEILGQLRPAKRLWEPLL